MYREITVDKYIDVECEPRNPVYLSWLSKTGVWNYWCFSYTQSHGIVTQDGTNYEEFIEELADVNKRKQLLSKSEIPKIVLGYSGLKTIKVQGVKGILSALKVLMLVSEKSVRPPVWQEVLVEAGSFKIYETSAGCHNLQLTLTLPEIFIQSI